MRAELSAEDRQMLDEFMNDVRCRLWLPRKQEAAILSDFRNALIYYHKQDVFLPEALYRLDPEKLGDFYYNERCDWYQLDSAGQIYPLSMDYKWMAVFRISIYFDQPVVPQLLQMALDFTIKRFPVFATSVKRGFFWNYLDGSKKRYLAEKERFIPCSDIKLSAAGAQPFRVIYHNNRLSVEFFHVLTDGTGGVIFLTTLAAEYLRLLGHDISCSERVWDIAAAPGREEALDEFLRADPQAVPPPLMEAPAVQLDGALSVNKLAQVLHFEMSAEQLLQKAKSHGATVTAYLLTCMFFACRDASSGKGVIKIQMPINMRQFYPSQTMRNFALYDIIRIPKDQIRDFSAVLDMVKQQMAQAVSPESLRNNLAMPGHFVSSVRGVPLFLKRPCAHLVYRLVGDKTITNTLSNIGVVKLPPEMEPFIEKMDFVLGTAVSNRASCTLITAGNKAVFTISKLTHDPSFENSMLAVLNSQGLYPEITGSRPYGRKTPDKQKHSGATVKKSRKDRNGRKK